MGSDQKLVELGWTFVGLGRIFEAAGLKLAVFDETPEAIDKRRLKFIFIKKFSKSLMNLWKAM